MYKYFVSYSYGDDVSFGNGCFFMTSDFKWYTEDVLFSIERHIAKEYGFNNVIITDWRLIEE